MNRFSLPDQIVKKSRPAYFEFLLYLGWWIKAAHADSNTFISWINHFIRSQHSWLIKWNGHTSWFILFAPVNRCGTDGIDNETPTRREEEKETDRENKPDLMRMNIFQSRFNWWTIKLWNVWNVTTSWKRIQLAAIKRCFIKDRNLSLPPNPAANEKRGEEKHAYILEPKKMKQNKSVTSFQSLGKSRHHKPEGRRETVKK